MTSTEILEQYRQYIHSFGAVVGFSEDDKSHLHPHKSVIHRKVRAMTTETLTKRGLSRARAGQKEFTKTRIEGTDYFVIEMNRGGLSCNDNCCFAGLINNGAIPLIKLQEWGSSFSTRSDGCGIFFGDIFFPIYRCYWRNLDAQSNSTFTVKDALNCKGKSENCRVGSSEFYCYWDKPHHATLFTQSKLQQPTDAFEFKDDYKFIEFNEPFFDYDSWEYCGHESDMVYMPSAILKIMESTETAIEDGIDKLDEPNQSIFRALLNIFEVCGDETRGKVDDLLCRLYDNNLTTIELKDVCVLMEEYVEEIYNNETFIWYQDLKPQVEIVMRKTEESEMNNRQLLDLQRQSNITEVIQSIDSI